MPKVINDDTAPKKTAPRKRATRPRAAGVSEKTPSPRVRRTASARVSDSTSVTSSSVRTRRAPTTVSTSDSKRNLSKEKPSVLFLSVLGFCIVTTGIGVVIGLSDKGQIDVVAVVNDRNERINRGEVREGETVTVPVASPQSSAGRLKVATPPTEESPSAVVPDSTAISTEQTDQSDGVSTSGTSTEVTSEEESAATATATIEAVLLFFFGK